MMFFTSGGLHFSSELCVPSRAQMEATKTHGGPMVSCGAGGVGLPATVHRATLAKDHFEVCV